MILLSDLVLNLPGFCLNQINLVVEKNDFFALIGPTGAGKSLVLEAIMGLMPVTSGRILVNGRDVTCMPPETRGVGIVYQDYALFPHLNVNKNILYGVPYHNIPQKDVKKRLDFLVDCMNLRPLLLRHPQTLSGGEKQRIALARALILNPKVLLLDEPLSAVDPMLQDDLKEMLSRLHKELNATFVMVSHNFSDVFFLANRGAVINTGEIVQTGLVQELFEKPNSCFAAEFVGMKNIFSIRHKGSSSVTISQNSCDIEIATGSTRYIPEASHVAFRPEDITLTDVPPSAQFLEGTVTALGAREFFYDVCIDAHGVQFTARCTRQNIVRQNLTPETRVFISIPQDRLHFF